MYLKSIEVYGFKSFANKITFEFKNGITGIVGPNGSGKSNVADAVRWVLGEQSAKQLRGAKMEDVIFSGTESRKPLGSAYVAITLDNSDHSLPIEYEEVTVARRVYRSGESEYLVNGTACRLKDVASLFFDTGIGKEGYSIIGQGQIDKILSGKPEDRRELFDEAAGIVKYKKNKAASEKSLEAEQQNLDRVNDILKELESQAGPLASQAATAKEYLAYREQQKELDVHVFLLERERLSAVKLDVESKIAISDGEVQETTKAYEDTRVEYGRLEQELEGLHQQIDGAKSGISEARLLREKLDGEVKVLKEQINTAKANDEHIKANLQRLRLNLGQKAEEKEQLYQQKRELDAHMQKMVLQSSGLNQKLEEKNHLVLELGREINQGKARIIDLMNESASVQGRMQRYNTMLEQIQLRRSELNQRLIKNRSEDSALGQEMAGLVSEKEELQARHEKLTGEIQENDTKYQRNSEKSRHNQERSNQVQQECHRTRSQLDTLRNMTERYEGYGSSIRKVMEHKAKAPGIHGVVADIIHVKQEYEVAVETALGGSIQNIVTDDENTAKQMIAYLKQNRFGRATFLPLTSITNRSTFYNEQALNEPGVIGLASGLVETESQYQNLAEYLLGRIVVVDHIDHAIALARKYKYSMRIVTIEGESLNPGGSMTGGSFRNNSNLLGRRRETEELNRTLKEQEEILTRTEQTAAVCQKEKALLRAKGDQLSRLKQELSLAVNTNRMKLEQTETRVKEIHNGLHVLKRESDELEKQIEEINRNKEELHAGGQKQTIERQEIESKIVRAEIRLKESEREAEQGKEAVSQAAIQTASIRQEGEFLVVNLKRIQTEEEQLNAEFEQVTASSTDVEKEVAQIHQQIETIQKEAQEKEDTAKRQEQSLRVWEQKRSEITQSHKEFFQKREAYNERLMALDKESYRLKGQLEKVEEQTEQLGQYMWEEYELTYHKAQMMRQQELTDLYLLKQELGEVKARMKALGDVNVNAIEDYKQVSERFEFLKVQRDDILKAEENLMQIIAELDAAMRCQFQEKFAAIQHMFDQVFKELFGGGKATLSLIEGEDVLEAGISIISQPPGKKLQNMMQLSGGEKALTAIALLFAIQSLKPSPFCLLDEIEAALDDANVKRFAGYLHKLTKDTQFIVITHRRGTMVAANVLYGITMQEKGVSTLVSVNLIENDLDK